MNDHDDTVSKNGVSRRQFVQMIAAGFGAITLGATGIPAHAMPEALTGQNAVSLGHLASGTAKPMHLLIADDFKQLIGTRFTVRQAKDTLKAHTFRMTGVAELMTTPSARRNPFAIYFEGLPLMDEYGDIIKQGTFLFQGQLLDGETVLVSMNGLAAGSTHLYEYEAVFG